MWFCVLGLGFQLRFAIPGWGVGVCACWCARSACTVPILAEVRGVGVCALARVSAAPRNSWLGPPVVRGGVHPLPVPRLSWRGCWGVCVSVCALLLYPANPGWGVRCGCVCLDSGFICAPPFLALVLGCVCVCVRARLVPRQSWHGCAVWVCVLGLGFRLRPATPGWGVGVRVLVCTLCLYPASRGWGLWCVGWMSPGTCCCTVVHCGFCALRGFAAPGGRCCLAPVRLLWLWPAACLSRTPRGPASVRRALSGPVALGSLVGFSDAVVPSLSPGACASGFTGRLRGACGGRPRTVLIVPAAGPCQGGVAVLAPCRTHSWPCDGVYSCESLRRRSWVACAAVVCVCRRGH